MATSRITKEVLFLKREYTTDELLQMGNELALARLRMEDIKAEEEVAKAQTKEKKAHVELTIGALSRKVVDKYEMINVDCVPIWDSPNVGEVTLVRKDTGEIAKIRVMSEAERQMDLPLGGDSLSSIIDSAKNVEEFFAKPDAEEPPAQENADDLQEGEEYDPFTDPDPAASKEAIKAENDAAFEGKPTEEPRKRGRPAKGPIGFDKPSNPSAISDF